MKIIEITRRAINYPDYVKRSAEEHDAEILVSEDAVLVLDGVPVVHYFKLDIDSTLMVNVLRTLEYAKTERSGGLVTQSKIFGYSPRVTMRKDFCSATAFANAQPLEHKIVTDFGRILANEYKKHSPDAYAQHMQKATSRVKEEWRIPGTPFTSGIINKNNPLKYHFDSGNFKNVYSNMVGFKRGVVGGHLAMPEFNVKLEIANNSVSIFDGQKILHGVTPIKYLDGDGYRYTVVYYSLEQMWKCEPLSGELARIRQVKTSRERNRAKPK